MDNTDKYNKYSKQRLAENLKKKFQTTIIGSLAAFEERFGFLWGHGLPMEELTPEQIKYREDWQSARTSILDLGNSNLRAAQGEIDQYTMSWDRYIVNFDIKEQGK